MTYGGLGSYNRERPDPLAKRPGESDEAHTRRIAPHLWHAETVEDQAWSEHRSRVDAPVGQGAGMFARMTPRERATAAGTRGFGGDQRVEQPGHLGANVTPGQPGVRRVYATDIQQDPARVSPLVAYSSGDGWQ
jgi:hypothetical protein